MDDKPRPVTASGWQQFGPHLVPATVLFLKPDPVTQPDLGFPLLLHDPGDHLEIRQRKAEQHVADRIGQPAQSRARYARPAEILKVQWNRPYWPCAIARARWCLVCNKRGKRGSEARVRSQAPAVSPSMATIRPSARSRLRSARAALAARRPIAARSTAPSTICRIAAASSSTVRSILRQCASSTSRSAAPHCLVKIGTQPHAAASTGASPNGSRSQVGNRKAWYPGYRASSSACGR